EVLMAHPKPVPVLNIGLPDFFIPQGTQEEARAELGLDAAGIEETRIANDVEELLNWIERDGEEPRTIYEASFQPGRLLTLRSRL
ncbi:hypothetical protein MJN54_34850, partial [Salmonella enterica subsp. enterica serovar Kentucky]|nr:hypothetical protein [Salmonella enterica subsp. enterica serovar Kentucky]